MGLVEGWVVGRLSTEEGTVELVVLWFCINVTAVTFVVLGHCIPATPLPG